MSRTPLFQLLRRTAALAALSRRSGESLDALQTRTHCGTNCGSCVPELKRLAQSVGH